MKKINFLTAILGCFVAVTGFGQVAQPLYFDVTKPVETRVNDFISKLTLEEKVDQLMYNSKGIPRLNIPAYNWWNEALHGVGRSGVATVFPQAIGLAATFDDSLVFNVASAVSDEARAMYNASVSKGYFMKYGGLTFWTPNINIFRDPRWGRGQETYGEDPFLTSRMGVSFVKGLQGNDPRYLKVAACAKHYAVHSGPEKLRHEFNAQASLKDLRETYLPAFKALVGNGVEAVMCAYNRTNDQPCCANEFLLNQVLRKEWGFKGHVVSDCWAIKDFYQGHNIVKDSIEASALALKRGVSLNCGDEFPGLVAAVKKGLVTEKQIDSSLAILLKTKFKLGMYDPKESNPYNSIPTDVINSPKHRQLARTVASKSIVMLKNNGVLPLKRDLSKYYVTGPNATNTDVLMGNYYGVNDNMVTFLEGLASRVKPGSQIQYKPGCLFDRPNDNPIDWTTEEVQLSDATFFVMGISGMIEGEEGESLASTHLGDRMDYNIPSSQINFLKKIRQNNKKPIIAIVTGGSPMNLSEVHELADAVLLVWYPGEEGGNAVADVVFGDVSPSGRLPITFPKSLDQLPSYNNYSMEGRTYRYMKAEPMYPFGFGLSYSRFEYSGIKLSAPAVKKQQAVEAEATVTNTGKYEGEEVVQLYLSDLETSTRAPQLALKGFKRVKLAPGASAKVKFTITPDMMALVNDKGESNIEAGKFKVYVGGSVPGSRSETLGAAKSTEAIFSVK